MLNQNGVRKIVVLPEVLKALSDETRYKLVVLLINHDYCVRALANRLGISESAVSQHLKILKTAGIVKGEKRSYFTHYCVDREIIKKTADQMISLAETPRKKVKCCKCKGE